MSPLMRPRHQRGQICKRGSNWVLRYHEERIEDGKVKRVRTQQPLASYAEYPYKGTDADLERLREKFHDKVASILASVNRENTARAQ
jgi:hypothetical protein